MFAHDEMETDTDGRIDDLLRRHRHLDRRIDNCRSPARQEELKLLKRARLRIKDRVAAMIRRAQPQP